MKTRLTAVAMVAALTALATGAAAQKAPAPAAPAPVAPAPVAAAPAIVAGLVNPDASSQIRTKVFKVNHPSVGQYVIIFATPFATPAICTFTPIRDAQIRVARYFVKNDRCSVSFGNGAGGPTDVLFAFLAAPAS